MSDAQNTPDNASRPARWQRALPKIKWMAIGLFIYASVYVLGEAKSLLVPIVLAFLLSMVFAPIRRVFDRRGVPHGLSSLVIVIVLMLAVFGVVTAVSTPATGWIDNAPQIQHKIQKRVSGVAGAFDGLLAANRRIQSLMHPGGSQAPEVKVDDTGVVTSAALTLPSIVAQVVFTFVLLLFLLASGDMFYEKIVHVMPTLRDKKQATAIVHNIERKLSRYLFTITLINAGLGVVVGLEMWAFGMPNPMVFGVLAFLLNFVPYLGALVGIVIAAAVALVSFSWIGWPLIIAGVYFLVNSFEGQFVTPYFVGRSLRLNTVMVFITISFWAWLWSAIGMIVAVPLLVAVKTFAEHIDGLDPLSDFLSERHAELED